MPEGETSRFDWIETDDVPWFTGSERTENPCAECSIRSLPTNFSAVYRALKQVFEATSS
jgi:hypothetical protein